ncbi:hypothetical protein G3I59_01515 [Amycolatopsis rubida]|uniref:XRE family transcriptional regulator n=1 Tax=Amycolatopsis rubida TaxID=112413 RepID=A0ABX0BIC7_9PSEU|nr:MULTISPECIES: hypothetical protein [Amycolatopsis]MYW89345.1 hypothetical protein [Amycolatopsis rubida]NEC54323.1 hypothetical protein [Amycolatopsis rubida]OAP21096.1 hypothetical protein A4R44_08071 [Amycolatopsis sp. M39]
MTTKDELAEALQAGPFCRALSAAARSRGLSLRQLQYRLGAKGVSLSVMTLSYWQSGRSLPEKPESLRAVGLLEDILALHPGCLLRLLGPGRPRGRGVRSAKPADRLHRAWGFPAFLPSLLARLPGGVEDPVRKVDLSESLHVTADRCVQRIEVRELVEARRDETRTMIVAARSRPGAPPPLISRGDQCRPGTVLTLLEEGFSLTELVLAKTLGRGERLAISYVQEYPRPAFADRHHRRIAESVARYRARFVFASGAEPLACRTWRSRTPEGATTGWIDVRPDLRRTVRLARRNATPGVHGLHWTWE